MIDLYELDKSQITLFDLSSEIPGRAFSPSTWRVRYALNFKKLPFKTHWVEFRDVQALCEALGADPTIKLPDGRVIYTLPIIYDPSSNRLISDSLPIVEYLDEAYSSLLHPQLIPTGTKGLIRAFTHAFLKELTPFYQFVIPTTIKWVPEESKEYFRTTREAYLKTTLEEALPKGEDGEREWAKVKAAFDVFATWFKANCAGSMDRDRVEWMMGDTLCYADLFVAAHLIWIIKVFGGDSPEWRDVQSWNNGKWGKLLENCRPYEGNL